MKKNKLFILISIISINLFVSCFDSSEENKKYIFRYNESSGITSLDPIFSNTKSNIWAVNHIFNGLVDLDENLNIVPSIAKSWKFDEKLLEYRFILRDDVFFHESDFFENDKKTRRVVASDFIYSFNRIKDDKFSSPGRWVMDYFLDDYPFQAINDTILIIRLKDPFPSIINILAMKYFSVVPKEAVKNQNFSKNPIGTGPFKFKYWMDNVKLVLLKNKRYFEFEENYRLPYLDAVNVSFIKNPESLFINFLQSKIDFVSGHYPIFQEEFLTIDGDMKSKYKKLFFLEKSPYLNTEFLAFNIDKCIQEQSILANLNIRKALNYSINKYEMIKYLRKNMVFPANSGIVPDFLSKYNFNAFSYNLDSVSNLLKIDNQQYSSVDLFTTPEYLDICEYLQSNFSEIGIDLNIKVNTPSVHRELVSSGSVCFFRGSWIADYPDPENYLQLFITKNKSPIGSNRTHFSNFYFDSLYNETFLIKDSEARSDIFYRMEKMLMDTAILIPLYYDMAVRFISKDIEDFSINSMNILSLKKVKKKL